MKRLSLAFPLALCLELSLLGSAWAQDAGTSSTADGGVGGCGAITFEGECQGNVVVYCDPDTDTVEMIDCPNDVDPAAVCSTISVDYGVDCAFPSGEGCLNSDQEVLFCTGTNPGCVDENDRVVCRNNVGPCAASTEGTCSGEYYVELCNEGQPYALKCAEFGATCQGDACRGVISGAPCNGTTLICETGLACAPTANPDFGICVNEHPDAGQEEDAGDEFPVDAGVVNMPKEEEKGCGCTTSHGAAAGSSALSALALIGIARTLRRRRS